MATTPLNTSTLFQGALASSTVLLTGCDGGTTAAVGVGLVAVSALGVGAYAIHSRWSQLQNNKALPAGPGVAGLLQSQADIPDDVVRSNLGDELVERYTVLGDADFANVRTVLSANIFKDWENQGRPADAAYPQLRGVVPEALIEARVASLIERLQAKGATGPAERLLSGLQIGEASNRSRRWAPLDVESSVAASLKSAYPSFSASQDADVRARLAGTVVKDAFRSWLKDSPVVIDKPGPATPQTEEFIQAAVHKLMTMLAKKTDDPRLASLLRDLRRDERRRSSVAQPIYPRLQSAVRELKALSLVASQVRFSDPVLREQLRRTMESLKDFPEAMSREDWNRFAALEGREGEERTVRELTGRLPALQSKANEALLKEEAASAQRLRWLQAAVAGEGSIAGLDSASIGTLHPLLPDWAGEVTVRQGGSTWKMVLNADGKVLDAATGLEMSYADGGFWLRDARGLSRLHPSNWLRAFAVNGRKIQAGGTWPVRGGDRMKVGTDVEIEFLLPEEPPLERLKLRISRIASLEDMARFLRAEGQPGAASQIEAYLEHGDDFSDLPKAGGLAAKVAELVLRREAGKLHEKYFLNLSYDAAETKMIALARSVAESTSASELARIAAESGLSDAEDISAAISRVFNSTADRTLDGIPSVFGFRDRVSFLVREDEKKMRIQIGALEAEVSSLSGKLRDANLGIENRDAALTAGAEREKNLNRELGEARQALVDQERAAAAEKARLLEEHSNARRAWEEARANLIDQHEQAKLGQDAIHRVALANQERNHGTVVARLNQEKDELIAAHAKAMAEASAAYTKEKEGIVAEHAEAIRLKNEEIESIKSAHARTVANMREQYRQATERTLGEHDAAMEELKAQHAEAMRAKGAEYEAALILRDNTHAEAMRRLEEARAAWEKRAGELDAARQVVERELGLARARAAAAERESGERLARIHQKEAEVAEVTGDRDSARDAAANYEAQFESMRNENNRLLKDVIEPLEKRLEENRKELSANGAMLAEIEVAISSLESLLKVELEVASTDDYLKRTERIRKSLEARLTALEAAQAAAMAASSQAAPTPADDNAVLPISHEDIPVVPIPFKEVDALDVEDAELIIAPSEQPIVGEQEPIVHEQDGVAHTIHEAVTQQIRVPKTLRDESQVQNILSENGRVDLQPGRTYVVGRGQDADIIIEDRNVSRKHFEIMENGGEWWVRDAGSSFGTVVNGSRLNHEWTAVGDGTEIYLSGYGDATFRLDKATGQASLRRGMGFSRPVFSFDAADSPFTFGSRELKLSDTDEAVGQEHVLFAFEKDAWFMTDLGEGRGTMVNGTEVSSGTSGKPGLPQRLKAGDWLKIGLKFFRVNVAEEKLHLIEPDAEEERHFTEQMYASIRAANASAAKSAPAAPAVSAPFLSLNPAPGSLDVGRAEFGGDASVAPKHVRFIFNGETGVWGIMDLGSGFPTYDVNGPMKQGAAFRVRSNDQFIVGTFGFTVVIDEENRFHLLRLPPAETNKLLAKFAAAASSAQPVSQAAQMQPPWLTFGPAQSGQTLGNFQLKHPSVADHHVQFVFNSENNRWFLRDMGSGKPTYFKGNAIQQAQGEHSAYYALQSKDWFIIGQFGFNVTIDAQNNLHFWAVAPELVTQKLAEIHSAMNGAGPASQPAARRSPPPPPSSNPGAIPPMPPVPGPRQSPPPFPPQVQAPKSPVPPPIPATRVSRALREAMERDERPDDAGIPMPSSLSSMAPAAPVSQGSVRPSGPPTIDAHGNIRLNGAQVVKIVSSSDRAGTSKQVEPGVWQVTIDQNWLMTDEWGWFGINKSGQFFFQKRVKSDDVLFNNGGAGLFQPMDYDKPIVIQDGVNVRVKGRGLRLWLS